MMLAASAVDASPLETYQALDDACRGESPSPSQEKACKACDNFHIEKMGYCYVNGPSSAESFWRKGKAHSGVNCK